MSHIEEREPRRFRDGVLEFLINWIICLVCGGFLMALGAFLYGYFGIGHASLLALLLSGLFAAFILPR